jgi:hypothetical protein
MLKSVHFSVHIAVILYQHDVTRMQGLMTALFYVTDEYRSNASVTVDLVICGLRVCNNFKRLHFVFSLPNQEE